MRIKLKNKRGNDLNGFDRLWTARVKKGGRLFTRALFGTSLRLANAGGPNLNGDLKR